MKKINLILIDDSVVVRRLIGGQLANFPDIELMATAVNGRIGVEKINQLNPDVVILDIEMPEMNGIEALIEIRKKHPLLPVIMFSSLVKESAEATLTALSHGANDYVAKNASGYSTKENIEMVCNELVYKIKGLVKSQQSTEAEPKLKTTVKAAPISTQTKPVHIVAIGTSTGGPNALKQVIPLIPKDFPVPIVVVQHMPALFTQLLAEALTRTSQVPVVEAKEGDVLVPGSIFIAPGNYHMTIVSEGKHHVVRLNQNEPENYCRPAVDVLFRSVAQCFGSHTLAVVMTGMGQDGLKGCNTIKEHKGQVIVQDEATSVVWGMPGAVANAGLACDILPLDAIGYAINQRVNKARLNHEY